MRIFATEIIETVKGNQVFEKLLVNGVCLLDNFEIEIKENQQYTSEFKTINAYMDLIANGKTLPLTKFREIKGGNIAIKRYEFKSKHLRIYAFSQVGGKIIVLGGYKNTQEADIRQFNSIVKEYHDSTQKPNRK